MTEAGYRAEAASFAPQHAAVSITKHYRYRCVFVANSMLAI